MPMGPGSFAQHHTGPAPPASTPHARRPDRKTCPVSETRSARDAPPHRPGTAPLRLLQTPRPPPASPPVPLIAPARPASAQEVTTARKGCWAAATPAHPAPEGRPLWCPAPAARPCGPGAARPVRAHGSPARAPPPGTGAAGTAVSATPPDYLPPANNRPPETTTMPHDSWPPGRPLHRASAARLSRATTAQARTRG